MKVLRWVGIGLVVVLVALQLVPYGRRHTNPPGRVEPRWDGPATRALAVRACYDCHSNETVWPWYSHVAPISWLAQYDVDEGRRKLNFSEWDRPQKEAHESAKTVRKREMPPWFYVAIHPDARLTAEETRALISGLEATLGRKNRQ
jgi:heme-binding protein